MKQRLGQWLTNPRVLAVIAIIIVAAIFLLSTNLLKMIAFWVGALLIVLLIVLICLEVIKRVHARKVSDEFGEALADAGGISNDNDVNQLRDRMRDAVKSIKSSKLGQTRGREALYELPWYMIIGNPAAGKSTAIANSGMNFPFADDHGTILQGIGGTRNCDWYFTSEGIILDTAGRYSVHTENRSEWLGFLGLLKKFRPRAPINGIIIAVSIAEITGNRPEFTIDLAKKLRERVQELTESLEVLAPIYVVVTKMDLVAGFQNFFNSLDDHERHQVWGATLPFDATGKTNIINAFDHHFDELSEGLREMSLAQLSLNRDAATASGALTLPMEFSELKSTLRTFISTLFEDNPFQFRPVFRGFYFTSALQEPEVVHKASSQIGKRFHLAPAADGDGPEGAHGSRSYFLLDLFRKVIFADKQLVRQYSSKQKRHSRYAMLVGAAVALSLVMGGWAWSYTNNRQLVANVQADLNKAIGVQKDNAGLQSRMQALLIIQDRLQQLQSYRKDHPMMLGLGLYQGNTIEAKLRQEYFAGMQQVMLDPVSQNMQAYLAKVVGHRDKLQHVTPGTNLQAGTPKDAFSGTQPDDISTEEAYNALKAYLMLSHPDRVEPVLLSNQLARFWRGWLNSNRGMMTRDQLIGSAQRLLSFYVAEYNQPNWPTIDPQLGLVADTRTSLRKVMSGMSAIDRVYAQIKARAATRYPAVTVASITANSADKAVLTGSYAVPSPFTHQAWREFIKPAFKNAAYNELSVKDWVLESSQATDLTLTGSPEQIEKQLTDKYKQEYITHWNKFMKGVGVTHFKTFAQAVAAIDQLGTPGNSPLQRLLTRIYAETSWDNPSLITQALSSEKEGVIAWFKQKILGRAPSEVGNVASHMDQPSASGKPLKAGVIGSHFTGITQMMVAQDGQPSLFDDYMTMLGTLRTRINKIKLQGDPAPGALTLMEQTIGQSGSPLSSGRQLVDRKLLSRLDDQQQKLLRPLLLRPLMQTFNALIKPAEMAINTAWEAQVYKPFKTRLAGKYPFNPSASMEATPAEMAGIFGPSGAIAKFVTESLNPLINQFGTALTPKHWANMGIALSPQLMANYALWTAPIGQKGGAANQSVFQIWPLPASGGIRGYRIDISGQKMEYMNTPPYWRSFIWSPSKRTHTTKVTAVTLAGQDVTVESFKGRSALGKLFQSASGGINKQGVYSLTWSKGDIKVAVKLRIISSPQMNANGTARRGLGEGIPAQVVGQPHEAKANTGNKETNA